MAAVVAGATVEGANVDAPRADGSDFDSEKSPLLRWACFRLSSSSQSGFRFSASSFADEDFAVESLLASVPLAAAGFYFNK